MFYVIVGVTLLITSVMFLYLVYRFAYLCAQPAAYLPPDFERNATKEIITNVFSMIHFFLLFVIPALTMRLVAEERRGGTYEILMTHPWANGAAAGQIPRRADGRGSFAQPDGRLSARHRVAGRAARMARGYFLLRGVLLVSGAYLAFGIFASSLTESQVVAVVISYVGLFTMFIFGGLTHNATGATLRRFADAIGVERHFTAFASGNLAAVDIVYFALFSAMFLFLAAQRLAVRRWRV
jgi:ABC-2 type transport system permease protein